MPFADVNDIRLSSVEMGDPGAVPLTRLRGASDDVLAPRADRCRDLELMERERPDVMAVQAARHDRSSDRGWWRELFRNAELPLVDHDPHDIRHTHVWIGGPQVVDFLARHADGPANAKDA